MVKHYIVKSSNRTGILFVLGSNVYGSDTEDEESLRLYKGGLLKYIIVIFSFYKMTFQHSFASGLTNPMRALRGIIDVICVILLCSCSGPYYLKRRARAGRRTVR